MRTIALILTVVSAIALILGAVMALAKASLVGVSGMGFTIFSMASSAYAIAIHVIKPFEKKETGA